MDERIELADGTIVKNSYVVKLDETKVNIVWKGQHTFREVQNLFCDPEKTQSMLSFQHGVTETWEGFTNPTYLSTTDRESYVTLTK